MRNSLFFSFFFELNSAYAIDQILLDEKTKIIALEFNKKNLNYVGRIENLNTKLFKSLKKKYLFLSLNVEKTFDFDRMYELLDRSAIIFFFKNRRFLIDYGSGNNNKIDNFLHRNLNIVEILEKIGNKIHHGKINVSVF